MVGEGNLHFNLLSALKILFWQPQMVKRRYSSAQTTNMTKERIGVNHPANNEHKRVLVHV